MSKAWYRPSAVPKLLSTFQTKTKSVEIWQTTCIVENFGKTKKSNTSILINPANPQLSGVRDFPYFPRGGPVPKEGVKSSTHADWQPLAFVSTWGGMEVGTGMMYPVSVIDGLVHQLGGWKLQLELSQKPILHKDEKCPIGQAISTTYGSSKLTNEYDIIIHTSPPFYKFHPNPKQALKSCYSHSFQLAFQTNEKLRIACPLLGAGARGFPSNIALEVASNCCIDWLCHGNTTVNSKEVMKADTESLEEINQTVAFGFLDYSEAEALGKEIEGKLLR